MAQQPMYQQPAAPSNMQYQSNPSNQQLNEKHNHNHNNSSWTFGFWDCCSPMDICCLSCWCPCIQYGKTQARNDGDPNASGIGGMCCAYYCLMYIGGHSILQAITRRSWRQKMGIEGSGAMDWVGACCCPCSGIVQEEKESLLRETGIDPKTKQQYQAPQQMHG